MIKAPQSKSKIKILSAQQVAQHAHGELLPKAQYVLLRHKLCVRFDQMRTQIRGKRETGGILIGCYRGPHIEILDWTDAGPNDDATLSSFVRKDSKHQEAALNAWKHSGATQTYIGEWHTHPVGDPDPSHLDRQTWTDVCRSQRRAGVFVIISPENWAAYFVSEISPEPIALTSIKHGDLGVVFTLPRPSKGGRDIGLNL